MNEVQKQVCDEELVPVGDNMQSALSRIIAEIESRDLTRFMGYEATMAVLEGKDTVRNWTYARVHYNEAK